ncbi:MAG: C_GCAxxG_C_C family protein [Deltaproteobacteria bacterium]|uniref:C_GCAxxG_C_C family protein n=1 Tax=Candidatus Zymogenus saltonus TaxID=2844893 RepID=A0A9D8KLT3_9DELT|nr:C_GCAxxG_C_C family protein [Candidatus Zymogenus saltonus]
MDEICKSCMTRRDVLKGAGRLSAALVASGGIPSVFAGAAEIGSKASVDINDKLDRRCLLTVLRMGHCAPSVMDTLLVDRKGNYEDMVRLTSGLPGGIGNTGAECGGVTSPIMFLGLKQGPEGEGESLLDLVVRGGGYIKRFRETHGTIYCREIQTPEGGISPCLRAMCSGRRLTNEVMGTDLDRLKSEIEAGALKSYDRLLSLFQDRKFHCAHCVLGELGGVIDVNKNLLKGSLGFVGGTVLRGDTCSALTAGVLALGSKIGEIEDSYIRVMSMMFKMMTGGDAMGDDVNKFNKAINVGNKLALWFKDRYGSTRCGDIVKTDFSNIDSVNKYLSSNRIESCREITLAVAERVQIIFSDLNV